MMQFKWIFVPACVILLAMSLADCSRQSAGKAQGYIEGRYTYMATPVSGVLKQLLVARGAQVKKDEILFVLEEQPESDEYAAAQEDLKQVIAARDAMAANLVYAKLTYERYKILVPKKAIEESALDNAKSIYDSTLAQLAQANANVASTTAKLAETKWTYEQKTIKAPVDAVVFDTYYRLGEFTEAKKAILSLLAPSDIKAIFYVYQPVLGSLHVGDAVSVQCDGCTQLYTAKISFISPTAEYTPPVIYSNETNVKLIYRIEAEFNPKDASKLHPGQPVNVTYHSYD